MKKNIYLLLALASFSPSMATQKVTTSLIIASSLVLSKTRKNRTFDKNLSLDLHYAVEKNDYVAAQKLINNRQVDVNAKVDYGTKLWQKGWTPLIKCCQQGDKSFKIANALFEHRDIEVNLQDNNGNTPLIKCCKNGDEAFKIARGLIIHSDINVNAQNKDGWTPLITCCIEGDKSLKVATALLAHQAINVNVQNNDGWTPLITCCIKGDKSLKVAIALLAHQTINVNIQDNKGNTPLDNIIYYIIDNKESYTCVKLWNVLVEQGALLNRYKQYYEQIKPNSFQEPQKTCVRLIKQNPPKNPKTNNKFMDEEE